MSSRRRSPHEATWALKSATPPPSDACSLSVITPSLVGGSPHASSEEARPRRQDSAASDPRGTKRWTDGREEETP